MARSHEIVITNSPEGAGLEIRPPLEAYELKLIEKFAPRLGEVVCHLYDNGETTGWEIKHEAEADTHANLRRVQTVAQEIRHLLENYGGIPVAVEGPAA